MPDDRFLGALIKEQLGCREVFHSTQVLRADMIKAIIGNCDYVISSRFHALIAALSQRIPALALGWTHKYLELMKEVGLEDNILELNWDKAAVSEALNQYYAKNDLQRKMLQQKVPSIQLSVQKNLKRILTP